MYVLTDMHTNATIFQVLILIFWQAPFTAGTYEARYYPSAMRSSITGKRHDVYWMKAKFMVICL